MADFNHPLPSGTIIPSRGGHFTYRIVGPCCRLFDREQLPWPCCRIQWHGKEPSWRRIGRRFTPDLAAQKAPSYGVEVLEPGCTGETIVLTLYDDRLTQKQQDWWYSRRRSKAMTTSHPPNPSQTDPSQTNSLATNNASQSLSVSPEGTADTAAKTEDGEGASAQKAALPPHMVQGVIPGL